ncbi:hypothetical protein PDESU_00223 [Pontiella desulfatans]|uniref:Right handed beta helix domain-containing protein n=1 Tax=Pontiella desulfatans TaxID=2750659 RepID=A0A6C2TVK6_PONDE|nr:hypothetical protein [Pontiella desulfatans]VGO11678.1 hypothetical protein PDESU_00223 [Pontiella desulfatans]
MKKQFIIAAAMAAAGAASAAHYNHSGDITSSVTWAAGDTHSMVDRVTVMPGATLTIEPGTIIASDGGSLAVTAGAQIHAEGTRAKPIIFTSVNDDFATWRPVCQEWGSLAIMGEGIISSHLYKGAPKNGTQNTPTAVGTHTRVMEGLVARGDGTEEYGGNNDDYDAGTLSYVSFRYGGQVLEETSELNGLSLGGIGRETQIDHIEIMNNVDDGIEIWGGTVCMKYISIWNIGDDSLDCDQGWRGKVQHGLIVQGYSADAKQGSGVGDNCIEMDGSEDSDCEPHTTSTLYNFTVIGNPTKGDHGLALRDNVRLQVRNSIFMDIPDVLIDEEYDGDGGSGWGFAQGTTVTPDDGDGNFYASHVALKTVPNMEDTYGVAFNANAYAGDLARIGVASNEIVYWAQADGYMNELTDTVLYNVVKGGHIDEIELFEYAGYNAEVVTNLPIVALERGPLVSLYGGALSCAPVTNLNPCAANDALVADSLPTNDGFFDPVSYRGAFSADENWLAGWTAAYQYGMLDGRTDAGATEIDGGVYLTVADSVEGQYYYVESSDNPGFASNVVVEATLVGTGSEIYYGDPAIESAKFFRITSY